MSKPLRKCKVCGLEAFTEDDLKLFLNDSRMFFGRQNKCKMCKNKESRKGGRYYENHLKNSLIWKHRNKEYLKKYDKARYDNFPEKPAAHRRRRMRLNYKTIYISKNPRKNICSACNKSLPNDLKQQTAIHHWFYLETNPLFGSIELCGSCHKKLPKTEWVDCICGVRYDGWLYKSCPICRNSNSSFSLENHEKYLLKIREVF